MTANKCEIYGTINPSDLTVNMADVGARQLSDVIHEPRSVTSDIEALRSIDVSLMYIWRLHIEARELSQSLYTFPVHDHFLASHSFHNISQSNATSK